MINHINSIAQILQLILDMGVGGSRTQNIYHTVYVEADPKLLAQLADITKKTSSLQSSIDSLESEMKKAEQESRKLQDPALYDIQRQKAFDRFVEHLDKMTFIKPIKKESAQQRHHIIIGNISCGKSSLLNNIFSLKQPVGLGECTPSIKKVTQFNKVFVWDSPGVNEHFKIYDPQVLAFFHCADRIFILYPDSLKSCSQVVKVLAKINPHETYLVRTQCDNWNPKMSKTIAQQIETDKMQLKQWKLNLPVLATSAKRGQEFCDNLKVSNLMKDQN